jgi:hypothetical protein
MSMTDHTASCHRYELYRPSSSTSRSPDPGKPPSSRESNPTTSLVIPYSYCNSLNPALLRPSVAPRQAHYLRLACPSSRRQPPSHTASCQTPPESPQVLLLPQEAQLVPPISLTPTQSSPPRTQQKQSPLIGFVVGASILISTPTCQSGSAPIHPLQRSSGHIVLPVPLLFSIHHTRYALSNNFKGHTRKLYVGHAFADLFPTGPSKDLAI